MHPNILPTTTPPSPTLDKALHIKYWLRCLNSLLPTQYQSNDSSRLLLAFLTLAALETLGVGARTLPTNHLISLRSWILKCQHPHGGFCGSPNHKYPERYYKEGDVDPANLASTFFGLLSLGFVGGLEEVDRVKTLRWLRRVQRGDGSFGELCMEDGSIAGGRDVRYCHFAAGIRRVLRGDLMVVRGEVEDIDVEGLARYITANATYDGGMGETAGHEAHAGYTYCGIAALSFLGRLSDGEGRVVGLQDVNSTVKWLMSRQTVYKSPPPDQDSDEEDGDGQDIPAAMEQLSLNESMDIGCNGRCNKKADTCYVFWVGAALKMINHGHLVDKEGLRRFLLNHTQHRIGGFGKCPGYPPDMYHSYLGLVALSILGESDLKAIDPVYCIPIDTKESIEASMLDIDSSSKTVYIKNGLLWHGNMKQ